MLDLLDYQFQLLQDFLLEQEQDLMLLYLLIHNFQTMLIFISQLINGMSSVLQKLLKCFNGTTISACFSVLLPSNFPVILVLYSKDFESLKLVSAIFYQIFIFSSSDRPSKTMKNVFYFILKALFVLEIFNFLSFFPSPSFPHSPDSKGQMKWNNL